MIIETAPAGAQTERPWPVLAGECWVWRLWLTGSTFSQFTIGRLDYALILPVCRRLDIVKRATSADVSKQADGGNGTTVTVLLGIAAKALNSAS